MTYYIMADDPTILPSEAINKSKRMMDGYKWKFFVLNLYFLPWILLCIMTLGIGLFWLVPYMQVTYALFYEDVKGNNAPSEYV